MHGLLDQQSGGAVKGFLSPSGKAVGVWTRHALQLRILLNCAFEQCISPLFLVCSLSGALFQCIFC